MATFQIPRSAFVPHPEGQHTGTVSEVEDLGMEIDPFKPPPAEGEKPATRWRVAIKIESDDIKMDDGRPYQIMIRCNMSGHPNSTLYNLRKGIAGRKLSEVETHNFDPDSIIGVRVGYLVEHVEGGNGQTYSNIKNNYAWRLPEEEQKKAEPSTTKTPHPLDHPSPPAPTEAPPSDDLPF